MNTYIIPEVIVGIIKNYYQYSKYTVSIIISISVVIIIQCMNNTIIPYIFKNDNIPIGADIMYIRIICEDENDAPANYLIDEELTKKINEVVNAKKFRTESIGTANINCKNETTPLQLNAVSIGNMCMFSDKIIYGNLLTDIEEKTTSNSILISDLTSKELFGKDNPTGRIIELNSETYGLMEMKIVGVFEYKGVIKKNGIPCYLLYDYMEHYYHINSCNNNEYSYYITSLTNKEATRSVIKTIVDMMVDDSTTEVEVFFSSDDTDISVEMIKVLTTIIAFFSILAYFIGSLSIMNLLIMSGDRRSKEIGIRKTVGAQISDIILQMIAEAFFISLFGTIIGVISGAFIGNMIDIIFCMISNFSLTLYFPIKETILAISVTFVISITFSIIPTLKVAKKQIVDSIRT